MAPTKLITPGGKQQPSLSISRFNSLWTKLIGFSFVLVVLPGVLFAVIAFSSARGALEHAVGRQLAEVALDAAHSFSNMLAKEKRNLRIWTRQDLMRELLIGDIDKRVSRFLSSVRGEEEEYLDLACTDTTGKIIAASRAGLLGRRFGTRSWFAAAISGRHPVRGPRYSSRYRRRLLVFASPIRHPDDRSRVIGVLVLFYDWQQANRIAAAMRRNLDALQTPLDILLLDRNGIVIGGAWRPEFADLAGRNLRRAGWRAAQSAGRPPAGTPQGNGTDGREGGDKGEGYSTEPRADSLVGHARVKPYSLSWSVLVLQPLDEALAPVRLMLERWTVALAGILLIALGVAATLAGRITRPLRQLTRATRKLARAEHAAPLVLVRSRDEIGELAEAFNSMAQNLDHAQEELLNAAKFAFIGEMAAGIAHEVRTPLGVVRTSAQILARSLGNSDPEKTELVEMMVAEVDRLNRVVNGLLELARPHEPQMEPAMLTPILDRAVEFVERPAREHGIELRRDLFAELPPAHCDPEQIYQVALNLLVNATQILKDGGRIAVRTLPEIDSMVGFEVRDNGPGMPPEVRERIFTPFFTTREGGTGLGLALVQRVIAAHHGTISVESTPRKGTTFRIHLPVARDV